MNDDGQWLTYLGLIMCRIVPATARRTTSEAATTYAQPRNGFFPPIHDTVEITTDFVPWYGNTGKSEIQTVLANIRGKSGC